MMRILTINGVGGETHQSLAVDPGVGTSGFTLLDYRKGTVSVFQFSGREEGNLIKRGFPEFLLLVKRTVKEQIKLMEERGVCFNHCSVVIEQTFYGGQFSVGLFLLISELTTVLLNRGVVKVSFVQPVAGRFFLKQKKTSKREIVKYVKEKFSNLIKFERLSSHVADSVLISVLVNSEYYERKGVDFRPFMIEELSLGGLND